MSFDNSYNQARVRKIADAMDFLEKSARSNRASDEEVAALLGGLLPRFTRYAGGAPAPAPAPTAAPSQYLPGSIPDRVNGLTQRELCDLISVAAIKLDTLLTA